MIKVDVHCHTSTHLMRGLHTESASIETILNKMDMFDIERSVILATAFPYKGTGLSTADALERIKDHKDRFMVFGTINVHEPLEYQRHMLAKYAEKHLIRGIKLYPGYQSFVMNEPQYAWIYGMAAHYHLPVMIHGGELHHCCTRVQQKCGEVCPLDSAGHLSHPNSMLDVFESFPDVRFVVSHLANPYFDDLRHAMWAHKNIWTDISGQWVSGKEDTPEYKRTITEVVRRFIDDGLIDRICFGTDFPIQSHTDSIELVNSLNLSEEDQKKIFYINPSRLLGIWRKEFEVEAQRLMEEVFPDSLLDIKE